MENPTISILLLVYLVYVVDGLTKVIVPAVYKEWLGKGPPNWVWDDALRQDLNYSLFLYQKLNSSLPNYVATNRGCENGVYYQYIVEHYDNFPDIAFFIHAHPDHHNHQWMDLVSCVRDNATYISLNLPKIMCRESWNGIWAKNGIWLEQCLRDTLRIVWGNLTVDELNERLPPNKPIRMCTHCCQQFLVSRNMIRSRPLHVWKQLQHILSIQDVCHAGEPDYDNLYSFNASSRMRLGPEYPTLGMGTANQYGRSPGRVTQAVTSEHLAHVIFGNTSLELPETTMEIICEQFLPNTVCPRSPCRVGESI